MEKWGILHPLGGALNGQELVTCFSAKSDLPLPHGLASSETMVSDHGLNPPLSAANPMHKGFSVSGAPFFGFGLADPAPRGRGRPLFADFWGPEHSVARLGLSRVPSMSLFYDISWKSWWRQAMMEDPKAALLVLLLELKKSVANF